MREDIVLVYKYEYNKNVAVCLERFKNWYH